MNHRIVLLGPPASGKGTQGRLMMDRWRVPVVSAGDVLRSEIAAGTPLGQEAARYMDHGSLVPDHVALAAVEGWLGKHGQEFVFDGFPRTVGQAEALETILARRHTSASGKADDDLRAPLPDVPTPHGARRLPSTFGLTAVLWLELPVALIQQRVSQRVVCVDCGRSFQVGTHVAGREAVCPVCGGALAIRHDDDPGKLATRMIAYDKSTAPLMAYYERRGLLRRIDAAQTADEVFSQIENATSADARMAAVVP